jgi:arylsulfatase
VKDRRVAYEVNSYGNPAGSIVASAPLETGKARIVLDFTPDQARLQKDPMPGRSIGPGVARLSINGKPAGEAAIANFGGYFGETLDVGSDLGSPVSPSYASPFAFTGKIESVRVDLE